MPLFRRSSDAAEEPGRWIVIGLGNPGPRYEVTRHNVGVRVIEYLAEDAGALLKSHKSGCLVAETGVGDDGVVLARSTSYMNETGRPLGQLMRWYKAGPDRLLVVHDELDIPFGDVRVKLGGGTAGHNGLRSIAAHLGTQSFARVRVGISRPRGYLDPADYVLQNFSGTERKELPEIIERAAGAAEAVVNKGVELAMNEVNTRT